MKPTLLTGILLVTSGAVCHAQFSLLPQVGFEQARSVLQYNNFAARSIEGNFKASLKMDYRFKGGHGPYISLGTSPGPVNYIFNSAGSLVNGLEAARSNLAFRIEPGYQYTSRPIQLGKKKAAASTTTTDVIAEQTIRKSSCGQSAYRSRCGQKKAAKSMASNNNLTMRLQPSLGLAYIPSAGESITPTADGFEYKGGNWKTALVPAMGFEFANDKRRLFTVTVFYSKALGLNDETYTNYSGTKAVSTELRPCASTWGISAGVPISFAKSKTTQIKEVKQTYQRTYSRKCTKVYQLN